MITAQPGGVETTLGFRSSGIRSRPLPGRYSPSLSLLLLGSDATMLALSLVAMLAISHTAFTTIAQDSGATSPMLLGAGLWIWLFYRMGMYRRTFAMAARDEVYASIAAGLLAAFPALTIALLTPALTPFREVSLGAIGLAFTGIAAGRYGVYALRGWLSPQAPRRVAVVGSSARVAAIPSELALTTKDHVLRIPVEEFDGRLAMIATDRDLERLEWLSEAIAWECDTLIVTEALPPDLVPAILRITEPRGIKLAYSPLRIRPHACDLRIDRDGSLALIYPRSLLICTPLVQALRRVVDLALVVPALIVLAPLFALIAAVVALDSGLPVFYRQVRVGSLGREFKIVKFRTMRTDAEAKTGPIWAKSGENRVTRIGKFLRRSSLDELPQLFNVLRGNMSLVGPRPERPFYVAQFRRMLPRYDERHLVRPGITGWSHVYMKRDVDTSAIGERLSYDLFYLEHWSPYMDALILVKTAAEVFFHDAAG